MFILDVGANHGEFSLEVARRNSCLSVIAIEPISELSSLIQAKAKSDDISNIRLVECAIDEVEREATLNISNHSDWGVSSLLDFDEEKLKDEYWSTRDDMYFDKQVEVSVRRLSSLCSELNVSSERRISFIKIDAQGLDLQVLISAGNYIEFIDAGMLEISANTELGLYKDEAHNMFSVLSWLDKNGFEVYRMKPNDPASNEFNVYFIRKGHDFHKLESELSLRGIDIYDGKFYWHFSSSKLLNIEQEHHTLQVESLSIKNELEEKDRAIVQQIELKEQYDERVRKNSPWVHNVQELIMWLESSRLIKLLRWLHK